MTKLLNTFGIALILVFSFAINVNADLVINEIRIDQAGADNDEYFEIYADGMAFADLSSFWFISIGDGAGGSGVVEAAVQLDAVALAAGEFWLVAESTFTLGTANQTVSMSLENSDNITYLLVTDFTGSVGDDLDIPDDGVLDAPEPWASIVDDVAIIETVGSGDLVYSTNTVGPNGTFAPAHIFRDVDGTAGAWQIGNFDPADGGDTPGFSNAIPEPGSALLIGMGSLALIVRRRRS